MYHRTLEYFFIPTDPKYSPLLESCDPTDVLVHDLRAHLTINSPPGVFTTFTHHTTNHSITGHLHYCFSTPPCCIITFLSFFCQLGSFSDIQTLIIVLNSNYIVMCTEDTKVIEKEWGFHKISNWFLGYFQGVSRDFQGTSRGFPVGVFRGFTMGFSGGFQWGFQGVSKWFPVNFQRNS